MRPFIYYSPDFAVPSFAFMLMVASLVATAVSYYMAPRRGLSQVAVLDLGIIGTILAVIGGRLLHVFVEEPAYYWEHPTHVYQIWRGGFVSYGAFIGLATGWVVYLKWRRLDTLTYLDHLSLFAAPFIDFFVRVGCLLAGCCFGKPSPHRHLEYVLYQIFNNRSGDAGSLFPGVPLWPTQIYSMAAAVVIFVLCYFIDKRKTFKGQTMTSFLMLYAFFRFMIEFLRGDDARGVYWSGMVSTGQIISLIAFALAVLLALILRKKYPLKPGVGNNPIPSPLSET
jgi:phosphatidylglycerol:prolipoprotein diacylglycerol transferase